MGNEVAAQRGTTGGLSIAVPAHIAAAMQAAGGGKQRWTGPARAGPGGGAWIGGWGDGGVGVGERMYPNKTQRF